MINRTSFNVHPNGGLIWKAWWIWDWTSVESDLIWYGRWFATTPVQPGNQSSRRFVYQQTAKPYPVEYRKGKLIASTDSPFNNNLDRYQKVVEQVLALERLLDWIDHD